MSVDLAINVQWSKTATVDIQARLAKSVDTAKVLAKYIRKRVQSGGTVTPPEPYDADPPRTATRGLAKKRAYHIGSDYGDAVGVDKYDFYSSAHFHQAAGAVAGRGLVSGGMWRGLRVRNYGGKGAIIDFGGSSLGQQSGKSIRRKRVDAAALVGMTAAAKALARRRAAPILDKRGKVQFRSKPKKARNQHKAAAVFKHSRIGVMQNTDGELQAMLWGYATATSRLTAFMFGGRLKSTYRPTNVDKAMYAEIVRVMRGR